MASPFTKVRIALVLLAPGLLAAVPAFAGSVVVGAVRGAVNTTMGQQPVIPGSTVFTGEDLRIGNGVAVVTVGQGSRVVFGRDSLARFERESNSVTARLGSGSVSVFHPLADKTDLHLRMGNVIVTPANGHQTMGEIAMNGNALVVSATDGVLTVQADGTVTSVTKGRTMNFTPKTARAPQTGGGQRITDWPQTLLWVAAGGASVAAILAGISISRSNDATNSANAAIAAANSAASAAAAAASAAAAALSDANAALSDAALASQNLCTAIAGLEAQNQSISVPAGTCSSH